MSENRNKTRGLGRGLSALMADVEPAATQSTPRRPDMSVPIEMIVPNPDQPRRTFTPEQLQDLSSSIATKGVLQPLIVRPRPGHEGQYEIVAGERRWRAAQMAKLHHLPVIVRDYNDTEVLEVAIIEINVIGESNSTRWCILDLLDQLGQYSWLSNLEILDGEGVARLLGFSFSPAHPYLLGFLQGRQLSITAFRCLHVWDRVRAILKNVFVHLLVATFDELIVF